MAKEDQGKKPEFDPSLHVIRPARRMSQETDDEALARRLQLELFEQDRIDREKEQAEAEKQDLELARRIEEEFANGAPANPPSEEDEALARRLQEEQDRTYGGGAGTPATGERSAEDAELARIMQDIEDNNLTRSLSLARLAPEPTVGVDGNNDSLNDSLADLNRAMEISRQEEESREERIKKSRAIAIKQREEEAKWRERANQAAKDDEASPVATAAPTESPNNSSQGAQPVADNSTNNSGTKKKKRNGILSSLRRELQETPRRGPDPIPLAIPPPPSRSAPGPLPHSVSIARDLPVAGHTELRSDSDNGPKPRRDPSRNKKNLPLCDVCGEPASSYLATLDKKFHPDCFKCIGCHEVIDASGPFAYMTDDQGLKNPLHRHCYAELYGVKCAVCMDSIPAGPDGKVSYVKHPFFEKEQMCPRHASDPGRRCTGCHRFEPRGDGFADLYDADRCVCSSCCRTVIVDSDDASPLWSKVLDFMEHKLNLPIWPDLREVPILVVGHDALNSQLKENANSAHSGSSQIMTRGLCLSEHESGQKIRLQKLKLDRDNQKFKAVDVEAKGYTYFQVPDADKVNPESSVTAILCLSGLPRDLTASVLAHEATHAWFKLHPSYSITNPIPLQVEEGCCQLVAQLFLSDGMDPASTETYDDRGPSDEKLRQYFKFSIETDENHIYGTGYRMAAQSHAKIGIEALLSHVVLYQEFPET